jgi:hypothetical protein
MAAPSARPKTASEVEEVPADAQVGVHELLFDGQAAIGTFEAVDAPARAPQ